MTTIPAGAREFLATGPLAHVVTLDPDGTPQVTLAWAGFDGDQVLLSSFFDQRKLDNLRRDPRITLSFEAHESGGERLHPYLVVSGRAHVTPGGALDVMDKLAEHYIGPGRRYGWREGPPGFTIRVDVDRVYGVGTWRGSEDDAEDEG
jgi:PPOX class probable F420-dependent enzyme